MKKLAPIGQRINTFENALVQNVKTFNQIFPDVPLTNCNENDIVLIGDITMNAVTREILINNIAKEHSFVRRSQSENDYLDINDDSDIDPDWLFYFV